MAHTEEKLESQTIYQGRIIAVTQDTVRLENGNCWKSRQESWSRERIRGRLRFGSWRRNAA